MLLTDHFPPRLPESLTGRYTTRVPIERDVEPVTALSTADQRRFDPEASEAVDQIRTRLVGLKSWSRRQVVVVPAMPDGTASTDRDAVGWVAVEDRASGRSNVQWVLDPGLPDHDALADALLDWAAECGGSFARHRGEPSTQLNAGIVEQDQDSADLLSRHGYEMVRTWLHMRREVQADEAATTPAPRPHVRIRQVHRHESGLPVAQDVRTVHRMLEESFADHFNSYRESFAEFVQRLIENPADAAWDHWWIAEVEREPETKPGVWLPAGGLVAAPIPASGRRGEGTYLEYLGVHRSARGHGVAKALLRAAIRDAAERGRDFVDLEVDADSPTHANEIYASMGWRTFERTQSWHATAPSHPSRLLEPPASV